MKISLFIPCLTDQIFPETGLAVVRLFEKLGHKIHYDDRQTCCGQALFNAGFEDDARKLAIRFIRIFQDCEVIVCPSGSCVSMVREHYGDIGLPEIYQKRWETLRTRIFEFTEFLVDKLQIFEFGATFPHKVFIHNSCHALQTLQIKTQPLKLLQSVQGIDLVGYQSEDECCGFGGVFSVKYPELSRAISDRKIQNIKSYSPEYVTGVDDSCLMHIENSMTRNKLNIKTIHIARILTGCMS